MLVFIMATFANVFENYDLNEDLYDDEYELDLDGENEGKCKDGQQHIFMRTKYPRDKGKIDHRPSWDKKMKQDFEVTISTAQSIFNYINL